AVTDAAAARPAAESLAAIHVQSGGGGELSEARIRVAVPIDRDWLPPTRVAIEHEVDASGRVRAVEREYAGAIVLAERPAPADPERAAHLLADAYERRGGSEG